MIPLSDPFTVILVLILIWMGIGIEYLWERRWPSQKETKAIFEVIENLGEKATTGAIFFEISMTKTTRISYKRVEVVLKYLLKKQKIEKDEKNFRIRRENQP